MKKSTLLLGVALATLWICVSWARTVVSAPLHIHIIIAALLLGSGAAFLLFQTKGDVASLTVFFQKPRSRVGYRASVGYFVATSALFMAFNPNTWQWTLSNHLNAAFSALPSILAITATPLYEEYFFRGSLQPILAHKLSHKMPQSKADLWAVYLSALVFWLFHAPLSPSVWQQAFSQGAIPLSPGAFFLGLACGFVALRDESLWFAILLHAFANWMGPVWGGILPASIMPYFFASS